LVILLVFFAYFLNLKFGRRRRAAALSAGSGGAVHSPARELTRGLACLVAGALGVVIGLQIADVQLGLAIALTAVVVGLVAFVLFIFRSLSARQSR
jgi:hypothetical protein